MKENTYHSSCMHTILIVLSALYFTSCKSTARLNEETDKERAVANKLDAQEAKNKYFALYKKNPKDPMAMYLWGRLTPDKDEQAKLAAELVSRYPGYAWGHFLLAWTYAEDEKFEPAAQECSKAAELYPESFDIQTRCNEIKDDLACAEKNVYKPDKLPYHKDIVLWGFFERDDYKLRHESYIQWNRLKSSDFSLGLLLVKTEYTLDDYTWQKEVEQFFIVFSKFHHRRISAVATKKTIYKRERWYQLARKLKDEEKMVWPASNPSPSMFNNGEKITVYGRWVEDTEDATGFLWVYGIEKGWTDGKNTDITNVVRRPDFEYRFQSE